MHLSSQNKIPVGWCPNPDCRRPVLYSDNPKDKVNITIHAALPDESGVMCRCSKCNTLYRVIEKPKVAAGYVALPIYRSKA